MLYSKLCYFELGPKKFELSYFFAHLMPLSMNPQEEGSSRSSRSLRGKILKRKVSQEPQEERSSRSSRGKILKRKDPQDHHQEEQFSRGKILKMKDSQEERFSRSQRYSRSSRGKILKILKIPKILKIIKRKELATLKVEHTY